MKRLGLLLCALLVGIALSGTSASAHGWRHHHDWYHHGWHHGWFFGGWHHGWRYRAAGGPIRRGPFCWVVTDDARGFGYYKWCDDDHRHLRRHHHHRR